MGNSRSQQSGGGGTAGGGRGGCRDKTLAWTQEEWREKLCVAAERHWKRKLDLKSTGLTLEGAKRMARAMRDNPEFVRKIKILSLQRNPQLGDAGLAAVVEGLSAALAESEDFALEELHIFNCGVMDLRVLVPQTSVSKSSLASSSSSPPSSSATTEAVASWLAGLKLLAAGENSLTTFPALLCERLASLQRLLLNDNVEPVLLLPAEMWHLPKECTIDLTDCDDCEVACGSGLSGGSVAVPSKFMSDWTEHPKIHDILAELEIENTGSGSLIKSASKS